ncbi:MAG: type IX secretion system sortase PorU [Bacteroidales bacterium]
MKNSSVIIISLLLICLPLLLRAEGDSYSFDLRWTSPQEIVQPDSSVIRLLHFENAVYHEDYLPYFEHKIRIDQFALKMDATLANPRYVALTNSELLIMNNLPEIGHQVKPEVKVSRARGQSYAIVRLLPFRLNMETGKYEKLISFELTLTIKEPYKAGNAQNNFADNSVLATGDWYKIRVAETGLYKITWTEMSEMGIDMSGLKSSDICLYGNGGGMLPESNEAFRYDDLQERAIQVFDGGDNSFDEGDYFIFYATGADIWKYEPMLFRFSHKKNIYSDYAYYFITTDKGPGKRVQNLTPGGETPNYVSTTFNDYAFHELEELNLIGSGREWYGELFDLQTSYDFSFNFPNLHAASSHYFKARVVAKAELSSAYLATVDDSTFTIAVDRTLDDPEGEYAKAVVKENRFLASGDDIDVNLQYNKSTNSAQGWLDYIELNVVRKSIFTGGQMSFRDVSAKGSSKIAEFNLSNVNQDVTVWEVSDPLNAQKIQATYSGSTLKYVLPSPNVREFVAFDGSSFLTAEFVEQVPNQNLHGLGTIDYVIVSHPDFLDQAVRLRDFHSAQSGLRTVVVTPQQVYNEFSSGAQDITAIKDLMRMLYERGGESNGPKYLLLFGDASYDFKNRIEIQHNFVPTFESQNSLHYIHSYATDDYFGYLDPEEGTHSSDLLDIGIGRLVVTTAEEAEVAVNKIIHYATSPESMGDWRNVITFVADDENGNTHLKQADQLANFIDSTYHEYNIDKIYIDAYIQESTPGGQRYPTVNSAINTRMEKGSMIMNYTGHGGEVGWAHERILENSDIYNWSNYNRLAVFITATCEFARYDDPNRTSAGEYVFLNPNGGGIALFTTSRATYGGSNFSLNLPLYQYAFQKTNGEYYAMGDLIRLAKLESSSSSNDKKFILLGDPALKMAYPDYRVETLNINYEQALETPDTLRALSKVTISGRIVDADGKLVPSFNGTLQATVFDKESEVTTLGQDDGSYERTFMLRKNTIYKGKNQVNNGEFSFSFIVPKDIAYNYGYGKISYFAENGEKSANGYYENIIIGGSDHTASIDNSGPLISLFMNDTLFQSGDITGPNPILLAKVFDENGINTVGNGIGHDIVAILNGDTENPYKLNEFYESDFGSYKSGSVMFPFSGLPSGDHELKFKIWDVFNNSSEASLRFTVVADDQVAIENLINYPNPFINETYFTFNHNHARSELDVVIRIFDFSGRQVAELQHNNVSGGFHTTPIRWDGTSQGGHRLKGGLYIYQVQVTDDEGHTFSAVKKLVISR